MAEALRAGRARTVLLAVEVRSSAGVERLVADAARAGVSVTRVPRSELDALGLGVHQGVAAFVVPPPELGERALRAFAFEPDALVVVLDGVTDPHNLGACARSAEAAGAALLIVRDRRAAPVTPGAVKASAGALLHLPVARVPNLVRALGLLGDRGFTVVGLDPTGEDLRVADAGRPLALVVGDEGSGLSRLVRERCDRLVAIPMFGRTASLNASAALAVGLFGYALRTTELPRPAATMPRAGVAQSGSASDL